MKGIIKNIEISKLVNYYENPRHAIGANEQDTLKKLFNSVGVQYMLNLGEDIQINGLLGNQQVVVVYSESIKKYVVYEGNRRIAAIKLLLEPNLFRFLDKANIEKAKCIAQKGHIPNVISCYVTDEEEAFFIMERIHSGDSKGKGIKQWNSREKETFKVRRSNKKNLSYLIDYYVKKYFDNLDITTILPFTTIQRIFNNREIRKQIGLDISDETTFTAAKMQAVIDASRWVVKESESCGIAVTRLFNKARNIEGSLLPWLQEYMKEESADPMQTAKLQGCNNAAERNELAANKISVSNTKSGSSDSIASGNTYNDKSCAQESAVDNTSSNYMTAGSGGSKNLPYFFQGLNYSALNPHNMDTHGISEICRELQMLSDKRLVATYPIAATFLIRSVIEQAIIYYSKTHKIQGQDKLIWENIKDLRELSKKIGNYKKNLCNYITDETIRQYFSNLFDDYGKHVDPLNWVIHKPAEFQIDANTLIALPREGLLAFINFMLS